MSRTPDDITPHLDSRSCTRSSSPQPEPIDSTNKLTKLFGSLVSTTSRARAASSASTATHKMSAMFQKFRRGSRDALQEALDSRTSSSRNASTVALETRQPPAEPETPAPKRLTFFDLPAEVRNAIYEFLINDTTLSLPPNFLRADRKSIRLPLALKRRKSTTTAPSSPVNGLLLANQQCRTEYLSILFATVHVAIEVIDFDFENLRRVEASLSDLELRSLRHNRNLTVLLMTRNCTPKNLASLRKWLEHRSRESAWSLPWRYEYPIDRMLPPTNTGKVRLLRELEYYADKITTLEAACNGEVMMAELRAVREAFAGKAGVLGEDLGVLAVENKMMPSQLRGLWGGGVR